MLKAAIGHFLPLLLALLAAGCDHAPTGDGRLEAVWGRRGISDGRLNKPRAMAIDRDDHLYIVDMTARIPLSKTEIPTNNINGNLLMTPIIQNLVVSNQYWI